jgi:prepilin-type N-terminal cleavage/methylation domain-containing protein
MRLESSSGLTLVEFLVVVLVLGILSAALFPAGTDPWTPNSTTVGVRGKDIYVALAAANAERQALGMQSLWPQDAAARAFTNAQASGLPIFTNSTDYFAWLLGGRDGAVTGGTRQALELDYSKLAGAGVSACPRIKGLAAENNLWTVAVNVRDDMDDIIPILITRNIDASSLAARTTKQSLKAKSLRFDSAWKTPFGRKGFVMIRKGGAIFKARPKYMTWGIVYQNQTFDTARAPDGRAAPPLKYLTPTREVVPGG